MTKAGIFRLYPLSLPLFCQNKKLLVGLFLLMYFVVRYCVIIKKNGKNALKKCNCMQQLQNYHCEPSLPHPNTTDEFFMP